VLLRCRSYRRCTAQQLSVHERALNSTQLEQPPIGEYADTKNENNKTPNKPSNPATHEPHVAT